MYEPSQRCLFWAAVSILALGTLPQASADDDVRDKFRARGNLGLTADALRETLTVVSPDHGFTLGLPYSESWEFDSQDRRRLGAADDRLSVDIRPRRQAEDDPWSQLDEYVDELIGSRADVRFPQIVEEDDRYVACVQVRTSEDKPWYWLYWTVIPSRGAWLQLTLIDAGVEALEPYDIDLVHLIARRFATIEADDEDPAGR